MSLSAVRLIGRALWLLAAAVALASGATAAELVEGKNYAAPHEPAAGRNRQEDRSHRVLLVRLPALRGVRASICDWLAKLPPDVAFRRVPVMFQERWVPLAKNYYTLEALGEESRLSPEVFIAIHGKGIALWNEKTFFDWAASKGLDRKKVEDMYNSFAITGKMNRAMQLAQEYNMQSVPMVIIDGKFVTVIDRVGTHAAMPAAIDALIVKARAERRRASVGERAIGRARRPQAPALNVFITGASAASAPRSRGITPRRARRSVFSRGAKPSSTRLPRRCRRRAYRPMRATSATRRRLRAPPAISSRASARPTSSSRTPASRAAR